MVGPDSYGISRAPHYLGVHQRRYFHFAYGAFTLCGSLSQHDSAIKTLCNSTGVLQHSAHGSRYTVCTTPAGLACIRFRLYPFRSPLLGASLSISFPPVTEMFHFTGSPPYQGRMDCSMQVSPFRHPRIKGCLLLPAAFRSWLRLSSASGAKAFPACPLYLNLINPLLTFYIKRVSCCVKKPVPKQDNGGDDRI